VIVEELRSLNTHPSARELWEIVRRQLPRISLGTVYRNLDLLSRQKEIQKIETGGEETRFDGNPSPHYHVRCVECGRVGDIHKVPEDLLPADFKEIEGYTILGYRLEFNGRCPECKVES
jgi:Fur family ferric uptake transcriptional regulator